MVKNEKLEIIHKQVDEAAKSMLNDIKNECDNFGEVKVELNKRLKGTKWENNDAIYIEVVLRSIKLFEKEIDTISC
ncbi:hypothetical protein [Enterococcus faecalis]|uniref:hypothetical protein n=1 Tax=Enterococcus phage EFC-1 TaxID=1486428 RepID=UPI000517B52B|nr:hypothetical protein [Enterococcus faecalis]YP_009103062.1 hypothetical protein PI32_gp26 [Enterococcus phage EFC-1]AIS73963.1 hypothetical protein [Enterococcus phage EFC-1]MDB1573813.1 hypothetical protein [Enterococcus faecalis]MDB1579035.1 hypothetical protein [Enterococcus faecalis]MDB1581899.1 hypothetical protein [Enterococcus faecalis]